MLKTSQTAQHILIVNAVSCRVRIQIVSPYDCVIKIVSLYPLIVVIYRIHAPHTDLPLT